MPDVYDWHGVVLSVSVPAVDCTLQQGADSSLTLVPTQDG